MKITNIGNFPGYKYGNIFIRNKTGKLARYAISIKLKDSFYNEFQNTPLEFFYSGPLSGRRELGDEGVKLCTHDISNREARIVSNAIFSNNQPEHDIGIIIIIPAMISDNPQSYIDVTLEYADADIINQISDGVLISSESINSGTPSYLKNKYFG